MLRRIFETDEDIKKLNDNLRDSLKKGLSHLGQITSTIEDEKIRKKLLTAESEIDSVSIALKKINQLIVLNNYPANLWKKIDLIEPLNNSIDKLKLRADKKDIEIRLTDNTQGKRIAYGELIIFEEFIFDNIISNAIKYGPQSSHIDITLESKDDHAYIIFRDYGMGMPQDYIERVHHVAERFYRPGVDGEIGSGMSYPIINRVMTKLNGALRIESYTEHTKENPRGTRVILRFNTF